jgi:hypothetical protein
MDIHRTKAAAVRAVEAAGYTELIAQSAAGALYAKPGAERDDRGFPLVTATVSAEDRRWVVRLPD